MDDRIEHKNKTFISTNLAAELTGYSQDYIGQMARDGSVASTRVGRQRFVDRDELVAYARENKSDFKLNDLPEEHQPKGAAAEDRSLNHQIERKNKTFISTNLAAELTGYSQDYVGQLARNGHITSTKEGRQRFVDRDELVAYAAENKSNFEVSDLPEEHQSVVLLPEVSPVFKEETVEAAKAGSDRITSRWRRTRDGLEALGDRIPVRKASKLPAAALAFMLAVMVGIGGLQMAGTVTTDSTSDLATVSEEQTEVSQLAAVQATQKSAADPSTLNVAIKEAHHSAGLAAAAVSSFGEYIVRPLKNLFVDSLFYGIAGLLEFGDMFTPDRPLYTAPSIVYDYDTGETTVPPTPGSAGSLTYITTTRDSSTDFTGGASLLQGVTRLAGMVATLSDRIDSKPSNEVSAAVRAYVKDHIDDVADLARANVEANLYDHPSTITLNGIEINDSASINQLTVTATTSIDGSTFFVDATNNRVGIGTTAPQYKLDVSGDVRAGGFITSGSTTLATTSISELTVTGNTTLGDNAASDTLTLNSRLLSSILPATSSTYSLGSAILRFADGFFANQVAVGGLTVSTSSITANSGAISFGDENLSTAGTFTAATTTLATTTISDLTATSAAIVSAAIQNLIATNSTTTNAFVASLMATDATFTNASTTNATTTNSYIRKLLADNSTTTNAYITNLVASSTDLTEAQIEDLVVTNSTTTNAYIATLTADDIISTNSTTTNAYIQTLAADIGSIADFTGENATITNATTTNFFSTLANFTTAIISNLTATVANITNLTASIASITDLTADNATTTNLYAQDATIDSITTAGDTITSFTGHGLSVVANALSVNDVDTLNTSLTAGSIVFSDGSTLSEDNTNFYWDDENKRLGIGTSTPSSIVHITDSASAGNVEQIIQNTGVSGAANIAFLNAQQEWKVGVLAGDQFRIRDHVGNSDVFIIESGAAANSLYIDAQGNIGIGTNDPQDRLQVDGGITASSLTAYDLETINALITNSTTTNAYISSLIAATSDLTDAEIENLIATNSTTTNSYAENLTANIASITDLTATDSIFTNASTTNAYIQSLIATNSTTTNAFVASLMATDSTFTNATTTNSYIQSLLSDNSTTTNAYITNLVASSTDLTEAQIEDLVVTNSTTTNAYIATLTADDIISTNSTTTNAYIQTLAADIGSIADFTGENATITNATTTNFFSTLANFTTAIISNLTAGVANITNLTASIASITDLTATNSTTTNATTTNSYITNLNADDAELINLIATNSTTTNAYISSLIAATSNLTDAEIENLIATNSTTTNAYISSLVTEAAEITNSTTTNSYAENLTANIASITDLTGENATITNATTTNFFASFANFTIAVIDNLTATAATITNLTASIASITDLTADNATTTNLVTTQLTATGTTDLATTTITGDLAVNTDDLFVDRATGRVGIGTVSPRTNLDLSDSGKIVAGTGIFQGTSVSGPYNSGSAAVTLYTLSGTTGRILSYDGSTYYDLAIGAWNGGNPNIMLKANSRVGIGVGSPTSQLSVAGGADFTGNVGIGTTSPATKLAVSGDANVTGFLNVNSSVALGSDGFAENSVFNIVAPAVGGTGRERLLYAKVADSDNYFSVINTTAVGGVFIPTFVGYAPDSSSGQQAVSFDGRITSANDTGTTPILTFRAQQLDGSTAVSSRPIAGFGSGTAGNTIRTAIWSSGGFSHGSTYTATDPGINNAIFEGNVGIGTASSSARLDVVSESGSSNTGVLVDGVNGATGIDVKAVNDSYALVIRNRSESTNVLRLYNTGYGTNTRGAVIDSYREGVGPLPLYLQLSGGNLGIGTTSPDNTLDVAGGIDADTLNTGQGDNELYAMNQNVRTTDGVVFNSASITAGLTADSATITNATTTNFFSALANFTTAVIDNLTASVANITNLTASIASITDLTADNATTTNLVTTELTASGSTNLATTTITGDLAVNTNDLFVDRATGRVGIGTANPSKKLHVYGDAGTDFLFQVESPNDPANFLLLANSAGKAQSFSFRNVSSSGDGWNIANNSSGNLVFTSRQSGTNTDRLTVLNTGNVGIGTTTPSNRLSVAGNANFTGNVGIGVTAPWMKFQVNGTDTSNVLFSGTTKGIRIGQSSTVSYLEGVDDTGFTSYQPLVVGGSYLALTNSGFEAVRITGENVGIGTAAPTGILSVTPPQYSYGTASQSLSTITGVGTTWTSDMVGSQFVYADGTNGGTITAVDSTTSLTVSTSQTVDSQEYKIAYTGLQVDSIGNVGIGTTDPSESLTVDGSVSITDGLTAENATITNATTTNFFASLANFTESFFDTLTATVATITNLEVENATSTNLVTTQFTATGTSDLATTTITGDLAVNTDDLFVDTGTGRVGIGTVSPSKALEVVGGIRSTENSQGGYFELGSGSGSQMTPLFHGVSDASDFGMRFIAEPEDGSQNSFSGGGIVFETRGISSGTAFSFDNGYQNPLITVLTSGNVGIGITNPASLLHVNGTISTEGITLGANDNITSFLGNQLAITSGSLGVVDGPGSGLDADTLDTLDSGQFLRSDTSDSFTSGTLTFAPGTTLNVEGDADFSGKLSISNDGQLVATADPSGTGIGQGTVYVNPATAGVNNVLLGLAVGGSERIRFDAEGDVQITGLFNSSNTVGTNVLSGSLTVDKDVRLGANASSTVTFNSRVDSDIIPDEDVTYSLGSPDLRFSSIYAATSTIDNLVSGGTASSTFIINQGNQTNDAEDATLGFSRGTASPNATLKWNSVAKRFEFNNFPVRFNNALDVVGSATSRISGGPLHLTGASGGTGITSSILYINPSSGSTNHALFAVAVNDAERFSVDAEGDTRVGASLGIQNELYQIGGDTVTIDDSLRVNTGIIKDGGGNQRLSLGSTNVITGNLRVTGLTPNRLVTTDGTSNLTNSITSANLASSITNETGTGQVVFSDSPVFTTQGTFFGETINSFTGHGLSVVLGELSIDDIDALNTSLAAGSVVFSDGNTLSEDNVNFFWDNATNRLGIGTNTPANKLDVAGGIDADTLNTGQGDNELYAMNQNVRTTDDVTFANATTTNFFASFANFTTAVIDNLTATAATITNLTASIASITDLTADNATTTQLVTTQLTATGTSDLATTTITGDLAVNTDDLFVDRATGRVGIGTVGPSKILHINPSSSDGLLIESDSGWPELSMIADSNTNDWRTRITQSPVNGALQFRVGQGSLGVDSSNDSKLYIQADGNVGIGTTAPGARLDVDKDIMSNTAGLAARLGGLPGSESSYAGIWLGGGTPSASNYAFLGSSSQTFFNAPNSGTADMEFRIGNITKFQVGNNGVSVNGVANTTPPHPFQISNSAKNSTLLTVLDGGNVGIGTTNPGSLLHMANSDGDTTLTISAGTPSVTAGTSTIDLIAYNSTSGTSPRGQISAIPTGTGDIDLAFYTTTAFSTPAEAMRIDDNGNVGIGTTTPDAPLTVAKTVGGTNSVFSHVRNIGGNSNQGAGVILSGSVGTKYNALLGTGDGRLFFYNNLSSIPTDHFANTPSMTILQSGNVGIGTASPGEKLEVVGNAEFRSTGSETKVFIDQSTGGSGDAFVQLRTQGSEDWALGIDRSDNHKFKISTHGGLGTNDRLTIDRTNGNVGIGITDPAAKLEIGPDSSASDNFMFIGSGGSNSAGIKFRRSNNTDASLLTDSNEDLILTYGEADLGGSFYIKRGSVGTAVATFDSSGNFGIGTASPVNKLQVETSSDTTIAITNSDTSLSSDQIVGILDFASSNETSLGGAYTPFAQIRALSAADVVGTGTTRGILSFSTVDTGDVLSEKMRITNTGNVGIGTTTPANKLDVAGGIDALTLNTGQGDNELYAMNQNVRTTDTPTFAGINVGADTITDFTGNQLSVSTGVLNVVDGTGSGLDADLLDGQEGTYYLARANHTGTQTLSTISDSGALAAMNDLSAFDTGDLSEGTNLYFTDQRARNVFSTTATGLEYSSATGVLALTSGYNIPLIASTTAWQNFYNTPSNRITAGTGLSWAGNTLNTDDVETLSTSLTAGSVVFSNGSNLAQDNANLFWDNTNKRLGIGTAIPSEALEVSGNIKLTDNNLSPTSVTFDSETSTGLRLTNPNGYISLTPLNSGTAHIYTDRNYFHFNRPIYSIANKFSAYSTGNLELQTAGTTRIIAMQATGNVGIGTTNPDDKLHVVDGGISLGENSDPHDFTFVANNGDNPGIRWSYDGYTKSSAKITTVGTDGFVVKGLGFFTGNDQDGTSEAQERMRITKDGDVGIGTTSPSTALDVVGTITATGGNSGQWNIAYTERGSQIAGSNLSWSGSVLNVVDGSGSGLDADLLDGQEGTYYLARANHTGTQTLSTISDSGALAAMNDLSAFSTTDLSEGTNLYFTDQRARNVFSTTATGLEYSSATGVLALTSGYDIPLTASTTDWNTAYTERGSQIAGSNLSWSGSVLDVVDGAGSGLDADTLDGLNSTQFLRRDTSDTLDAGANTSLTILSDDSGASTLNLYGDSQGTGRVYVGQSTTHGGGIEYNGDGNPSTTGAGSDYFTLWRRSASVDYWTARNLYSSNDWEFRADVSAASFTAGADTITDFTGNQLSVSTGVLNVVDGTGSGLDADLLDGQEGTYYLARANHTGTQTLSTISDSGALAAMNDLSAFDTGDLSEGTNLYFTDARARNAVSGGSGINYSSATGIFSLDNTGDWTGTFDGQEGTYYLARANHTGTQTLSTISDSGALAALDDLSTFSTDNLSQGSTNLYSQWATIGSDITYNGGGVGIGVNSPAFLAEIAGGASAQTTTIMDLRSNFSDTNTGTTLRLTNSTAANPDHHRVEITALRTNAGSAGAHDLIFSLSNGTSMTERMRILSNGNVGIGISTPSSKLHIEGDGSSLVKWQRTGESDLFGIEANSDGFGFNNYTLDNYNIWFSDVGNIGVGTTTPAYKLDVAGSGNFTGLTVGGNTVWHQGNDGAGSGLDADLLDGLDSSFYDDQTVSQVLATGNDAGNQEMINVNGIRFGSANSPGTWQLYGTGNYYTSGYVRGDSGVYVGDDEYFFSDSNGRIATDDDFYVRSGAGNTYLYSTNVYLGGSSGDNVYVRGNPISGNNWSISTSGNVRNTSSQGYLELSGHLPGYSDNTYPTLKTDHGTIYFSAGGQYSAYMTSNGVWTANSNRELKENFITLDDQEIRSKIDQLPMTKWNFKSESPDVQHIGPIAQDFHALFGLNGPEDTMISHIDPSGVALVGVKAVSSQLRQYEDNVKIVDGNIAIGMSNPSFLLHVNGSAGKPGGGSWSDSSDVRLKKNITAIDSALDAITRLKPVHFNWRNPELHGGEEASGGFIAQEVAEIFPEWVNKTTARGADADLVGSDGEMYVLNLPFEFDAYIVGAIKELNEEVQELAANRFWVEEMNGVQPTDNFLAAVRVALEDFMGDVSARFREVLAERVIAESSLEAGEKICIDGECLTKSQLRSLIDMANGQTTTDSSTSGGGMDSLEPRDEGGDTTADTSTTTDTTASTTDPTPTSSNDSGEGAETTASSTDSVEEETSTTTEETSTTAEGETSTTTSTTEDTAVTEDTTTSNTSSTTEESTTDTSTSTAEQL